MDYHKISQAIGEYLNMNCILSPRLNPPGFHVYQRNAQDKVIIEPNLWHNDSLFGITLESFLIPIVLPTEPCGLDYFNTQGEKVRYNYEVNNLYHWHGSLNHSISNMKLERGESRITLQMHGIENEGKLELFW